mmetsp:Transcript_40334/g.48880  ORF Transcript_40334/g.48880 Transcript_40334/m.48880 type:complete len:154 (+) Transcript_40334:220-681(+)|eukprot:CAMPEP_0197848570 /NCGR_PEP_ID=MMETSP1438-20131217/9135_1 /TAXON_ID=1461541 /ORGANISM="Pterosperma sp., Strain CCMP1384" /LENGTH=153 /DNA_ID=CAMNT_0043460875 /DNA_START=206 /DNA_END=667 /DNA_ORIENTATION=+
MSHFPGVDVHHVRGQDHLKQWNLKEQRRRERAGDKDPSKAEPSETLHDSTPKALAEYRRLASQTRAATEAVQKFSDDPIYDMSTPKLLKPVPQKPQPPHMVHHHHFGWGGPQVEKDINDRPQAHDTVTYHKYGDALSYCQDIHSKSHLLSSRR